MAFSLRLPPDMEADLKHLAALHSRSMHGEMLHALKQYLQQEKGPSMYQVSSELHNSATQRTFTREEWVQADSEQAALDFEAELIEQQYGDPNGTVQLLDSKVTATREK